MWRYDAVLPFAPGTPIARLGEGGTPLIPLPGLARTLGLSELTLKEESGNATQSFKATSGDFTYTIPEFVGRDVDLFFNASGLRREEVSFTREEYGGGFGAHKFFKPAGARNNRAGRSGALRSNSAQRSISAAILAGPAAQNIPLGCV